VYFGRGGADEYEAFEINSKGEELYSRKFHDAVNEVAFDGTIVCEADTGAETAYIVEIRTGGKVFRPVEG
jgi:hypothetical protein